MKRAGLYRGRGLSHNQKAQASRRKGPHADEKLHWSLLVESQFWFGSPDSCQSP